MDQRTCVSCGVVFTPRARGNGRTRLNCYECSPYRARGYTPKPAAHRTCSECSESSGRWKTCSARCTWARRKRLAGLPCVECGATTGWVRGEKSAPPTPRCRECTKTPCGTVAAYNRGCRCAECHAAKNEESRLYRIRRRESGNPLRRKTRWVGPLVSKVCERCGDRFETRERVTRFCTISCSQYARSGRSASREVVHVGTVACSTVAPVTVVRRTENWAGFMYGPCAWCGVAFMAATATFKDKYCSKRCGSRAGRSRHGRFWVTDRKRLAIYERDGWTCQLCFDPIDRDAHYLDSWAPSLDHIEPQSAALIPDDSAKNLRTAHMWCNSVRGDGTYHADFFEVVL